MPEKSDKSTKFWQELKRRKVLPFLIGYVAACFAIIEFVLNASETFSLPEKILRLLYPLSAIGLPVVILLPWIINRKKKEEGEEDHDHKTETIKEEKKTILHNLPAQLTSFIGRKNEMKVVKELVAEHRLVTLTGTGGCGKTRLACEAVTQLIPDYKDGIWFVDLTPISDGNHVTKEIMEVLDIKEVPNQPIIETLIDQIKNKSQLIILDNCENLIKVCAEIADKLLKSVEGVRILVTSREALNIQGEALVRIPSLSFPDSGTDENIEDVQQYEAIELFTDRAVSGNPGFSLNPQNVSHVVGICQRVAGIPLAIELAATRIRHLGPETILERLNDQFKVLTSSDKTAPERQKTLKTTIDWSYNLLSVQEQLLFCRMSVFAGDFDLEALEGTCSDERVTKDNVINVLSQLVDKSLINIENQADGSIRYKWLMPLQQYSLQKLIESGEEKKQRKKHLVYYLKMAEQAYKEQFDSEFKWINKLELEHDNLIVALNWSFTQSIEEFILLPGYLTWLWRNKSKLQLAVDYLEKALSRDAGKSEAHARNLLGLGQIVLYTGEIPRSIKLLNDSLEIWRKLKNLWEEAVVLGWLGSVISSSDQETALKYREQSLGIARRVGNPGLVRYCLLFLCQQYAHSHQYDRGMPLVEELYDSSIKQEYPFGIYASLHFRSDLVLSTKDYKEAERQYALALETGLKYGIVLYAVMDIQGVAFALSGQSRWAKSIRLDTASREKMKAMGLYIDGLYKFWDEWIETYLQGARKEVGEELTRQYEEEGQAMGFEEAVEYALDLKKD